MLRETAQDVEQLAELPPDAPRALDRLSGSPAGRKDKKLIRRSRMPRAHAPKRRMRIGALVTQTEFLAMRQLVFDRAGQRCERCGRHRADVGVLHAHHRQLTARGGEDRVANLASLCPECHEWVHRNVKTATGLGYIVPSGADPASRPMLLPGGRRWLLTDAGTYELAA